MFEELLFFFAISFVTHCIYDYPYTNNNNVNSSIEYEKAIRFSEIGCNCGCSKRVPKEKFAELREAFQALSRPEQDIF